MAFSIATFNAKNLIGPNKVYYPFESLTDEAYAWKVEWLSNQLLAMDSDVVGFQEIFEEDALAHVIRETDEKGAQSNAASQPGHDAPHARRAIYRRIRYDAYGESALAFAPNLNNREKDGKRRPGLALLSRHPIVETSCIQDLSDDPIQSEFMQLAGGKAGQWTLSRLSRPIQRVVLKIEGKEVTIFNAHLKSKHGEFTRGAEAFAGEENLLEFDPLGRAFGAMRAALRRLGEALALRRAVLAELETGRPVVVLGDMNDYQNAVSSEIIAGERPFKNYSWIRRHDADHQDDRYTRQDNSQIQRAVRAVRLESAERIFVKQAERDFIYTASFNGIYESLDQILLSPQFQHGTEDQIGELTYLQCFNDHLTDGSFDEAPYNKLASDHGQLVATLRWL